MTEAQPCPAATGADLIAISGDLFDRNTRQGQIVSAMRALCQVAPVYYVSGNHEWTVEDRQQIWAEMEEAGVVLLDNQWVAFQREGEQILLAGIQDPNGPADRATPEAVFAGMPFGQFTILLYHRNTEPPGLGAAGRRPDPLRSRSRRTDPVALGGRLGRYQPGAVSEVRWRRLYRQRGEICGKPGPGE